uniref:Uncharacterized protein n=1 Tax=Anopheles atroparvus TaxID=41427 RepID=A0AAG5DFF3_ANOAO
MCHHVNSVLSSTNTTNCPSTTTTTTTTTTSTSTTTASTSTKNRLPLLPHHHYNKITFSRAACCFFCHDYGYHRTVPLLATVVPISKN